MGEELLDHGYLYFIKIKMVKFQSLTYLFSFLFIPLDCFSKILFGHAPAHFILNTFLMCVSEVLLQSLFSRHVILLFSF